MKSPIYASLWFNNQAAEAAQYYCDIFSDGKILNQSPFVVTFEVNKTKIMAINGNVDFKFNESVSFVVECDTQEEIDHLWNSFLPDGKELMCGWIKDKYGVCWQVIPSVLSELMSNPQKAPKVSEAFLKMKKFDIAQLLKAANG